MSCANPALFRRIATTPGSRPKKSPTTCGTTWDVAWWSHAGPRARFSRATAARSIRPARTPASGCRRAMSNARWRGGGRGFRQFQLAMARIDLPPHTGMGYQWPASMLTAGDMQMLDRLATDNCYTSVTLRTQNVTLPCRILLFRTFLSMKKPCVTRCHARLYQVPPVGLEPTTL